jgi:4'-phosphopantetheinyl transferase
LMQPVVLEYLDLDAPHLALPVDSLNEAERERAARFHFDEDRRRFVHGRAWLRLRISEAVGIAPNAIEFTTIGERGKPGVLPPVGGSLLPTGRVASPVGGSLLPTEGLLPTFNLSHSAQHGLLALHAGGVPLGVDIEVARPFERAARIAARHFNVAEAATVEAAAAGKERETIFFRTWTRKEAYLKLTGLGLPGGLACVETGTEAAPRVLQVPPQHGLQSAWVTSIPLKVPGEPVLAALAAPQAVDMVWRRGMAD